MSKKSGAKPNRQSKDPKATQSSAASERARAAAKARWANTTPEQRAAVSARLREAKAAKAEKAAKAAAARARRSAAARKAWERLSWPERQLRIERLQNAARDARARKYMAAHPEEYGAPHPSDPIAPPLEAEGRAKGPPNTQWEYRETREIDGRHDGRQLGPWMAELATQADNWPGLEIAVRVLVKPDRGGEISAVIVIGPFATQRGESIAQHVASLVEEAARGVLYNEGVADARKPPTLPDNEAARAAYDAVMGAITGPYSSVDPHNFAEVTVVATPATPQELETARINGEILGGWEDAPF